MGLIPNIEDDLQFLEECVVLEKENGSKAIGGGLNNRVVFHVRELRQRVAELENERNDLLEANRIACENLVERHDRIAELTAVLKTQEPALVRYNKHMAGESEPDPVERLRFFLSLALTGKNWLDVEKFLDDLPPADVVRDAERYRWLRDSGKGDDLIRGDCRGVYLPESAALDAAIDAAMKEK